MNNEHIVFHISDVDTRKHRHGVSSRGTGFLIIPESGMYWDCVSGGYGKGVLPHGIYKLESCLKIADTPKNKPYFPLKGAGTFGWFARLTPQFNTSRGSFGIHPDGRTKNVSEGCPCVTEATDECFLMLNDLLKTYDEVYLKVL